MDRADVYRKDNNIVGTTGKKYKKKQEKLMQPFNLNFVGGYTSHARFP